MCYHVEKEEGDMTAKSLKRYIQARDVLREGKRELAISLLASALGAESPTPILVDNVEKLLDIETLAGEAILPLIIYNARKED